MCFSTLGELNDQPSCGLSMQRNCLHLKQLQFTLLTLTSFPGSLSSASLVLGRETLVAAGHMTTCDTKFSTGVESTNNFHVSQPKRRLKERRSLDVIAILNHTQANTPLKFSSPILSFTQVKQIIFKHTNNISSITLI